MSVFAGHRRHPFLQLGDRARAGALDRGLLLPDLQRRRLVQSRLLAGSLHQRDDQPGLTCLHIISLVQVWPRPRWVCRRQIRPNDRQAPDSWVPTPIPDTLAPCTTAPLPALLRSQLPAPLLPAAASCYNTEWPPTHSEQRIPTATTAKARTACALSATACPAARCCTARLAPGRSSSRSLWCRDSPTKEMINPV